MKVWEYILTDEQAHDASFTMRMAQNISKEAKLELEPTYDLLNSFFKERLGF